MRLKLFKFITKLATQHPWKVVAVAVAVAVISGIGAATSIKLNSNLDELVSEKLDYHKRYIEFLKEFGDEEYLYVVVDAEKDLPEAKKFTEGLGAKLKKLPDLKQVIWKIENPVLEKNFLLYLSADQLNTLTKMTTEGPFAVRNIATWDGFAPMFGALASRIGGTVSVSDEKELATGFTFIDGLLDDMIASIDRGAPYRSRLQALFFGDGETFDPDGFIKNGSLLFIMIMPEKDFGTASVIEKPLKEIRRAIDEEKRSYPEITAGLTGRPVLSADEMETSNRDMTLATIIAIILVSIVFILFFRNISRPLCAVAALIIGISWTFGFIALAVGTINILSSVFVLLLIGASVEYSIYIVARYEEELAKTGNVAYAIEGALTTTAMANVTSALTTAAAFCTLIWTDFAALAQLGIISAAGIVLCLVSMLVVLPALLNLRDRRKHVIELKRVRAFSMPALAKLYKRPNFLLGGAVLAVVVFAFFIPKVGFDNNLLNMQARGLDSVKYEHLIIEKSSETTWFARAAADTIEESHKMAEEFRKLPSVRRVDDVEKILPEEQSAKAAIVKNMAPAFENINFTEVGNKIDDRRLMFELGRLASNLERLESQAFTSGRVDAVEELGKFAAKTRKLVSIIADADEGTSSSRRKSGSSENTGSPLKARGDDKLKKKFVAEPLQNLGNLQREFFADLARNLTILAGGMHPTEIKLSDLPQDVRERFVSPKGRYSLYIYPKENIWDPPALKKFVDEIRSVSPSVVGTPIEVHESGCIMRETFVRSAVLAFLVICVLVWLDFRCWRATIIALTPLVFGLVWLVGAMGLFGIQFNMANFFAIPILIGAGVDFGVQVTHRLRHEKGFSALGTSTGKGLIMTALANGIGFGTMMIAHHLGVRSLGEILALGCVLCLAAALFAAPPIAKWLKWGRG